MPKNIPNPLLLFPNQPKQTTHQHQSSATHPHKHTKQRKKQESPNKHAQIKGVVRRLSPQANCTNKYGASWAEGQ